MKWYFETFVIAASLAFIGWVIITAGVKFEVKWDDKAYGFTIGGATKEEKHIDFVNAMYWSNGMWDMELIFTLKELENVKADVFEDFLRTMFPLIVSCNARQYGNLIHIEVKPCEYPYRPNYKYLPIPELKSTYTVVGRS